MRELQHLQAKTALGSQLCTTVGHQQAKTFLFIDPVKLLVNSTFLFFFSIFPHRSQESQICKTQARKLQNDAYHDVQREFKHCLDPALFRRGAIANPSINLLHLLAGLLREKTLPRLLKNLKWTDYARPAFPVCGLRYLLQFYILFHCHMFP